ncbi:hypothetical protein ACH4UM_38535 [Streptomyces sp. NPDC020801]|uniref:hypothetical protein n=1 Tax=Streptomyces sp. NPDC020801 TaxID=3365093 RepID=UPI0037A9990A
MTHEEEDTAVEFTFDFTEQRDEPIVLAPEPSPGHPPTILARSEPLLTSRFRRLTTD